MKRLLLTFGHILSCIYPHQLAVKLSFVRSYIYTGWISRSFKQMEGFVNYPISLSGGKNISIGKQSVIGKGTVFQAWEDGHHHPSIIIGDKVRIGQDAHITAISDIVIGNGVQTGRRVLISDNSHGNSQNQIELNIPVVERSIYTKGGVTIGNNVWLGDNAVVLSGVTIGDGTIVGANAVVTKDLPAYSVCAGVPAKVLKQL